MFLPVSIIGHQHPLSDFPFDFLIYNQQHDAVQIQSFTLDKRKEQDDDRFLKFKYAVYIHTHFILMRLFLYYYQKLFSIFIKQDGFQSLLNVDTFIQVIQVPSKPS